MGSALGWPELIALREFNKTVTDHQRIMHCGCLIRKRGADGADEIIEVRKYCAHVWLCPTCAAIHAKKWHRSLRQNVSEWIQADGDMAMLTLTVAHDRDDELAAVLARLDAGWAGLQRGSSWSADRHRFGIRAHLRVTEVIHQDTAGWHPHFHVLLFRDPTFAGSDWNELGDRLSTRFRRSVRAAGGAAELAGQHLAPIGRDTAQAAVSYCVKGALAPRTERGRTPVVLLADLMTTGEGIDLVKEFATTMGYRKHRRYSPSRDLRKLLDTTRRS